MPFSKLILIFLVYFLLSSCMNTASTGVQMISNRHNLSNTYHDHLTSDHIYRKIYVDTKRFQHTNIAISTFNKVVLLAGQVPTPELKKEAEELARSVDHVNELHNLLEISTPTSSLTRMSDAWITTKVKSQFFASNEVDPNEIKVVTEDGTVYLMGIVPRDQARVAVEIARTTQGVQRVVKVFTYLDLSRV